CMLLKAHSQGAAWLNRVALMFFAPATSGAHAERIARLISRWRPGGMFDLTRILVRWRWPVTRDLAVNSEFLNHVRHNTELLFSSGGHQNFESKMTVFGTLDNIIDLSQPELSFDSPYIYVADRDHVTICKPNDGTAEPYQRFKNAIGSL